jgi:pantoate--beta-alanine ligase
VRIASTRQEVRQAVAEARGGGSTIGLAPTLGGLHAGHEALIRASVRDCDFTVVSVFVNPTQFGPAEDLAKYPRDLQGDAAKAEAAGADLVFAPAAEEMYPEGFATTVQVAELTEGLCGAFRPGHFDGVTTVCCKLFEIVQPDRAYFGEKDYQQLVVIRRMVRDLDLPLEIVAVPTVREPDGLAMSTRNRYLAEQERRAAPALYRALQEGARAAREGASGDQVEQVVAAALAHEPLFTSQYLSAVDPETLEPLEGRGRPMVIAAAAFLGGARLIDNLKVE